MKRERHVQLKPYKAKLFIHYSLFIFFATNQKISNRNSEIELFNR